MSATRMLYILARVVVVAELLGRGILLSDWRAGLLQDEPSAEAVEPLPQATAREGPRSQASGPSCIMSRSYA